MQSIVSQGFTVTGAGPGGGPHVKVFDVKFGDELASFFAYEAAFRGGVNVALGDVNDDGVPDVITGAGVGGGPHVKIFDGSDPSGDTDVVNFFAYDAEFTGGGFVAGLTSGEESPLGSPLRVAGGPASLPIDAPHLTNAQADMLVHTAAAQMGFSVEDFSVPVHVVDLPNDLLGLTSSAGTIYLDVDAAGYGWFLDPTPETNEEYVMTGEALVAADGSPAR